MENKNKKSSEVKKQTSKAKETKFYKLIKQTKEKIKAENAKSIMYIKLRYKKILRDYFMLTMGAIITAIALEIIIAPNNLVDGGTTAISIIANNLFDVPIYLVLMTINIPIIMFASTTLGKIFFIRTLYSNLIAYIALYLFSPIPAVTSADVLVVLYGGTILGLGVGLVVKYGGAIDGTEVLAVWANKKFGIQISRFLIIANAIILSAVIFVYSLESAMFSLAIYYLVTKIIDAVLEGFNSNKSLLIISKHYELMGEAISKQLKTTVTFFKGKGGYTGEDCIIIMCIANRYTYAPLKNLVLDIDPNAIIQITNVSETKNVKFKYSN